MRARVEIERELRLESRHQVGRSQPVVLAVLTVPYVELVGLWFQVIHVSIRRRTNHFTEPAPRRSVSSLFGDLP